MAGNNSRSGTTVLEKVTKILEAFAGNRVTMTLSELSRATDLPASTVHRLAGELVTWGGLERTEEGEYAVGLRLWEIAARSPRSLDLRESAMPFLQDLFDDTRQHVQLAVLDGSDALLLEKISGPHAIYTIGRPGGRLPLHASAVGKVLLATSSAECQERFLARRLTAYTPQTITSARTLVRQLAHVRDRGFAVSAEELSSGVVSCAAAVTGPGQEPLGAVSVLMPAESGPPRRWSQVVTAAAAAISGALLQRRSAPAISARLTGR
ncbi:IclR family transcriptional regulator [Nocardia carnea]|uniref:IclR family transcriptional regulator n=1 Tax=Nocardia carnea TaxID=37328 RepID=UPI00245599FA|nr:IclR family transcriptional regulator [Nocardia carnea]